VTKFTRGGLGSKEGCFSIGGCITINFGAKEKVLDQCMNVEERREGTVQGGKRPRKVKQAEFGIGDVMRGLYFQAGYTRKGLLLRTGISGLLRSDGRVGKTRNRKGEIAGLERCLLVGNRKRFLKKTLPMMPALARKTGGGDLENWV